MNTANSSSSSVFEIDNDLNITKFDVVYSNQTQRIFRIFVNNTLNETIGNISWLFNTGQDNKTSIYNFTLNYAELIQIYIFQNYTTPGNYTPEMTIKSENRIERMLIPIEVT